MTDYRRKLDLGGKTALVTGAGQGIGAAIAMALAQTGARVHCTDINLARAESVAATLPAGTVAGIHRLDVTDTMALQALAESLPALDVLVCNAGIARNTPACDVDDAEWQTVIDINLTGVFRTCRAFGRKMVEAGRGSVVNIGSMSGMIVNWPQPQAHYNASKAAVHHLTKSLAVEWATSGVRVNAVAPTYIRTPLIAGVAEGASGMMEQWLNLTPMGRLGEPEEIASVVQFLASDAASLMTGSIVAVDGGYTSI